MHNTSSISVKIKIALAVAMILWASAFVGIRAGLHGYSPGVLALLRFLVASVCMFFIYLRLPSRNNINRRDICRLLLIGAVTLGCYHVPLNYGEQSVSSGIASFVISQSPILTTIFAILFLGERLSLYGLLGMTISFSGMILILLGQGDGIKLDIGIFYILLAAISGSIYSVLQKTFLKKYHAIEVTTYLVWGGTLALLIYLPALSAEVLHAPTHATLAVVYLGVFPGAIAYLAWGYALASMPASRATNFLYFMPIMATLLGWMCLGEVPVLFSLLGGVIALLGVWIVNESYHKAMSQQMVVD